MARGIKKEGEDKSLSTHPVHVTGWLWGVETLVSYVYEKMFNHTMASKAVTAPGPEYSRAIVDYFCEWCLWHHHLPENRVNFAQKQTHYPTGSTRKIKRSKTLKAFRSHVQRRTKSKCKTRCCFTMLGNWQPLKGCFRQRICWVEYRPESRLGFADQVDPVRFRKILRG
ncbi:hypothetical protein CEXT_239121 [Caerostris extrusa]|uniref:Uncharacterized protein n=1 Tax=Caerostris extrusa TaxID=172846 RepID=A0AAV4NV57_CAEEX|nr:hypothetical protein CEXT_239121 [Caerostris extrusa]